MTAPSPAYPSKILSPAHSGIMMLPEIPIHSNDRTLRNDRRRKSEEKKGKEKEERKRRSKREAVIYISVIIQDTSFLDRPRLGVSLRKSSTASPNCSFPNNSLVDMLLGLTITESLPAPEGIIFPFLISISLLGDVSHSFPRGAELPLPFPTPPEEVFSALSSSVASPAAVRVCPFMLSLRSGAIIVCPPRS